MRTSVTSPKARKQHVCIACLSYILPGETYERCRWWDSGDAGTSRMHPECAKETDAAGYFDNGDRILAGWLADGEQSPEWTAWYESRGVQS